MSRLNEKLNNKKISKLMGTKNKHSSMTKNDQEKLNNEFIETNIEIPTNPHSPKASLSAPIKPFHLPTFLAHSTLS